VYGYNSDVIGTAGESYEVDDEFEPKGRLCSSCERDDLRDTSEYHELYNEHRSDSKDQSHSSMQDIKSSLLQNLPSKSSFLSFVGTSARKAMAIATGSAPHTSSERLTTTTIKQTQSETYNTSSAIAHRIDCASFAVLLESNETGAAEYVLNPPRWKEEKTHSHEDHQSPGNVYKSRFFSNREEFHVAEEKFATGLQLLQNNVIALCFRAGVDASKLWPAESMLLNLYSLLCHCMHVVGLEAD
jgi:hypothetical protein